VSQATDYLREQLQLSLAKAPMVTLVTLQPHQVAPPGFKPAIAAYGWGINGTVQKDGSGNPVGLTIPEVLVWFSDRLTNPADSPPISQQFDKNGRDRMKLTAMISGEVVSLTAILLTWGNATWTASTTMTDGAGKQLIFPEVPGAGPNAPSATLVLSFHPKGMIGFL
jgi:hypothetical protein